MPTILEVTTAEIHAKFLHQGLTRYSYAEIIASVEALNAAMAESEAAAEEGAAILRADWVAQWPAGETARGLAVYSEHLDELAQLDQAFCDLPGDAGSGSGEYFPVAKWNRMAAAHRNYAKKMRRAIAALSDAYRVAA